MAAAGGAKEASEEPEWEWGTSALTHSRPEGELLPILAHTWVGRGLSLSLSVSPCWPARRRFRVENPPLHWMDPAPAGGKEEGKIPSGMNDR